MYSKCTTEIKYSTDSISVAATAAQFTRYRFAFVEREFGIVSSKKLILHPEEVPKLCYH